LTDKLKAPPEINELPYKEERSILYSQMKSGDKDQIIEAARKVFIKTLNPIYFYVLLNNLGEKHGMVDVSGLLECYSGEPVADYLAGSYNIRKNSIKEAYSEFIRACQKLQSSKAGENKTSTAQLPIFSLIVDKRGLAFAPKLINLQTAAQNNIKLLKPYLNKNTNIKFHDITIEHLKQYEMEYNKTNLYPGISIEEFLSIGVRIMPSGLANNTFILELKGKKRGLIEIPFPGDAVTQRALLLFLMRIREINQNRDKDEDDVFYKPEVYKKYYKEALSRIADNREGELNFQTSSEWWGIPGYKNRKSHVSRIHKVFKEHNVTGQVVVPHQTGCNGSYLLVSHLRACFKPSHY
jgi:hypothetical protein